MKITNAFSFGMLATFPTSMKVTALTADEVRTRLKAGVVESAVGHADTAALFSTILGMAIPMNRVSLSLVPGDEIIVGQYTGPRLPEGATTLPEGAAIRWLHVVTS